MSALLLPVLLVLEALLAPGEEAGWTWTDREQKQIRQLERQATEVAGIYRVAEGGWKVETPGSARLAAEIVLFLNLVEDTVVDVIGEQGRLLSTPTVAVLSSREEFLEKAPDGERAAYRYRWVQETGGRAAARQVVLENHLYTYFETDEPPAFAALDLGALRAEGAKAVLAGVIGRQHVCGWFEQGVGAFFASFDLRAGRKADDGERRRRSPGIAAIVEQYGGEEQWLPNIEPLLRLDGEAWRRKRLSDIVSNDALAESVVDLLLTSRKARSMRDRLMKEIGQEGTGVSGRFVPAARDQKRLETLWHEHIREALAQPVRK